MPRNDDQSAPASDPVIAAAFAETVRSEFREMPGLCLTEVQACRLWHMEPTLCQAILQSLVDVGFLVKAQSGTYRML